MARCPECSHTGNVGDPCPDHAELRFVDEALLKKYKKDDLLGHYLPRGYSVLGVLGQGGMGFVYRATQESMDRDVALKVLNVDRRDNAEVRERFEREARILSKLHSPTTHPNLVQIYDFWTSEGSDPQIFLAMELIKGRAFEDWLESEDASRGDQLLQIAKGIASGLAKAHEYNIIHRDLKPDNIILVEEEDGLVPKLLDFGIARLDSSKSHITRTGIVFGTPAYMSPEQAFGETSITPGTDVYSFGVMLFEMLSGKRPFDGENPLQLLFAHANATPPEIKLRPGLSASIALIDLANHCLSKAPKDRPADGSELLRTLNAIAGDPLATSVSGVVPPVMTQTPLMAVSNAKGSGLETRSSLYGGPKRSPLATIISTEDDQALSMALAGAFDPFSNQPDEAFGLDEDEDAPATIAMAAIPVTDTSESNASSQNSDAEIPSPSNHPTFINQVSPLISGEDPPPATLRQTSPLERHKRSILVGALILGLLFLTLMCSGGEDEKDEKPKEESSSSKQEEDPNKDPTEGEATTPADSTTKKTAATPSAEGTDPASLKKDTSSPSPAVVASPKEKLNPTDSEVVSAPSGEPPPSPATANTAPPLDNTGAPEVIPTKVGAPPNIPPTEEDPEEASEAAFEALEAAAEIAAEEITRQIERNRKGSDRARKDSEKARKRLEKERKKFSKKWHKGKRKKKGKKKKRKHGH